MIKVVITDDQRLLRESLKDLLVRDAEVEVAGCAADGREALAICEQTAPDVVLMDLRMPVCDGIEGTRLIKDRFPSIKVLVLTTFEDDRDVYRALKVGADGYLLKDLTPDELIRAIKNTAAGLSVFSRQAHASIVRQWEQTGGPAADRLKEQEIQTIRLIAEGATNREIAERLFLSEGRIKNLVSEILAKLGLKDRNQLAGYAYKHGLIE